MTEKWADSREYLESQRSHLFSELTEAAQVEVAERDSRGSFSKPDEAASDFSETEKHAARRGNLFQRLQQIDVALGRIERGTYGVCERCGKPIPRERLEAMPQAISCVKCKLGP
jgi:DnaK suppressor protein